MAARRASRRSRPPRARRTWPQRMVIIINAVALTAAVTVAGSLAYSNESVARIQRNHFRDGVLTDLDTASGEAANILVVGLDDASGLDPDDDVTRRATGVRLTDTVMVLRLDPVTGDAALLSFPRDLVVEAAGSGARGRINGLFEAGGAELLINTIGEAYGIPIHHYIQVDFAGFRGLVEAIDGVPVQFPRPVRSRSSVELDIPEAGCWVLGPRQALGFTRVRKDFQVRDDDGDWHTDLSGDFARVERQQLFIQLALRRAVAKGARNLTTMQRLIDVGITAVSLDTELTPDLLLEVGRAFRTFDPSEMRTYTLPVDMAPSGGPAYLYLREQEAEPILAAFRGDEDVAEGTVPTGEVTVRVVNGTGTERQAGDVTGALGMMGFTTVLPGADVQPGFPTILQHAPGADAAALTVARHVVGPVRYQLRDDLGGADVVVVTGTDWLGVTPDARPVDEVEAPDTTGPSTATSTTTTSTPDDDRGDDVDEETTGTELGAGGEGTAVRIDGDPDDPDDPAFFRVTAPAPDATCLPTE